MGFLVSRFLLTPAAMPSLMILRRLCLALFVCLALVVIHPAGELPDAVAAGEGKTVKQNNTRTKRTTRRKSRRTGRKQVKVEDVEVKPKTDGTVMKTNGMARRTTRKKPVVMEETTTKKRVMNRRNRRTTRKKTNEVDVTKAADMTASAEMMEGAADEPAKPKKTTRRTTRRTTKKKVEADQQPVVEAEVEPQGAPEPTVMALTDVEVAKNQIDESPSGKGRAGALRVVKQRLVSRRFIKDAADDSYQVELVDPGDLTSKPQYKITGGGLFKVRASQKDKPTRFRDKIKRAFNKDADREYLVVADPSYCNGACDLPGEGLAVVAESSRSPIFRALNKINRTFHLVEIGKDIGRSTTVRKSLIDVVKIGGPQLLANLFGEAVVISGGSGPVNVGTVISALLAGKVGTEISMGVKNRVKAREDAFGQAIDDLKGRSEADLDRLTFDSAYDLYKKKLVDIDKAAGRQRRQYTEPMAKVDFAKGLIDNGL